MLEYIGARALIERELRLTDFLVLLTTVANIGKILSFFECRQLRICNYVLCTTVAIATFLSVHFCNFQEVVNFEFD